MEALSLDELIRKNSMGDQFMLLNHRKRDRNIDEEELDYELEEYIREARVDGMDEDGDVKMEAADAPCEKFNRPSMRDGDDNSSDDENELLITAASLNTTAIKEEEEEEENTEVSEGRYKSFQTAESREGIRVRSQQFRLLPENLVDRPVGMKRLLPLPLDESERYKKRRGVLSGRVQKRNDSRASSSTSFASSLTHISSAGRYVEKGKFSFKVGERGIVGIDRVRRGPQEEPTPSLHVQENHASTSAPGITVNMNWQGFFEGMTKVAGRLAPEPPAVKETTGDELCLAATKLLQLLKAKNGQSVDV